MKKSSAYATRPRRVPIYMCVRACVCVCVSPCVYMCVGVCVCECLYSHLEYIMDSLVDYKVKLATVVEGDQKDPFLIATTPRRRSTPFSWLLHFTLDSISYYWVLSKKVSSTIFKVFGMTRPRIEHRSPGGKYGHSRYGTHGTANKSIYNNLMFFFDSHFKIVYYNNY